jgi:hypothetical protein
MRRRGEQRVAVRLGAKHELRAQIAAGTGAALDDELLAEARRELLRSRAREEVGGAARREGNDDAHRLRRIRLRERGGGRERQDAEPFHRVFSSS